MLQDDDVDPVYNNSNLRFITKIGLHVYHLKDLLEVNTLPEFNDLLFISSFSNIFTIIINAEVLIE